MPFFGPTSAECKWTVKQLKAEIVARKGTPPENNRKKSSWDALYKLRVVQSSADEDREAVEDGECDGIAFGANDFCGLAHCMSSPALALAVARDLAGKNRSQLDDKSVPKTVFHKEIPELFNSTDLNDDFTHPAPADTEIADIDANNRLRGRSGAKLKSVWGWIRSVITFIFNKWAQSGQNDPDNFVNFCDPNGLTCECHGLSQSTLIYIMRLMYNSRSLEMHCRAMDPGTALEFDNSTESHAPPLARSRKNSPRPTVPPTPVSNPSKEAFFAFKSKNEASSLRVGLLNEVKIWAQYIEDEQDTPLRERAEDKMLQLKRKAMDIEI
jgi:hypothetical protein